MTNGTGSRPATTPARGEGREVITVAGGCFWCVEAIFDELAGVDKVESGYSGGRVPNPTYEQVSTGTTGHAEAVQITFDPGVVPLGDLLRIFFTVHDPTTKDRQGADVGTQYRSAVFCRDDDQRRTALSVIRDIEAKGIWGEAIVTEVVPFQAFYPAEGYHQEYFERNGSRSYCRTVIAPKVAEFRKQFFDKLKK